MRPAAAIVTALVFVGCGGDADAPEPLVESDGIAVLDAWVRPTPPTADEAAIYLSVENRSDATTAITGAESPSCMVITPHATTITDDGVASMGEALDDQLALPAGASVTMAPQGLHMMCLGLAEPLAVGEAIDLRIDLADREPIAVSVAVEQR